MKKIIWIIKIRRRKTDKEEEDFEGGATDLPIAMTPRDGNITLLQMDGEISKDELVKAIELGKEACMKIFELQKKALKENYKW